ncbi:MAG: Unknown protein [uncultured Sulfurovum sp.]|uniref:Uncharacterized protein n=1 Tax=uncultured Sulfurovum sp. TaxID=269237 RepID=A0A6S6T8H4_9BACT|nr:MAG: Unknown protein [uncultured Sulfurovum sp.]
MTLFLNLQLLLAQENITMNKEFLIGMLNDYNGLQLQENNENNEINYFYADENQSYEIFMEALKTIFNAEEFDFIVKQKSNISIYSPKHKKLFHDFYNFKKEKETNFSIGFLNEKKFNNPTKKLLFILGTYARFGSMNKKGEVQLKLTNSLSHFQATQNFLKALKFEIIEVSTSGEATFPQTQTIIFIPNDKSREFFEKLM